MMNLYSYKMSRFGLLFVCAFCLSVADSAFSEVLSVQGEKSILRTDPDQKAKQIWEYGSGFPVEVLKRQGDWLLVKDFENDSGWIHKSNLHKGKNVIVKANSSGEKAINIRSGPGTENPIVAYAYYGVVFAAQEKKSSWIHVSHESGISGWVKLDFLWGNIKGK
jgi:SH3-like domain-containing protein